MRDLYGLEMLARLEKPSDVRLVNDVKEMEEVYESLLEMKSDPDRYSKLESTFSKHRTEVGEVMAIFGEVSELEELLGEFPELE